MSRLSSLIRFYFTLGLRHWEILLSLSNINGIVISATLRDNQAIVEDTGSPWSATEAPESSSATFVS